MFFSVVSYAFSLVSLLLIANLVLSQFSGLGLVSVVKVEFEDSRCVPRCLFLWFHMRFLLPLYF